MNREREKEKDAETKRKMCKCIQMLNIFSIVYNFIYNFPSILNEEETKKEKIVVTHFFPSCVLKAFTFQKSYSIDFITFLSLKCFFAHCNRNHFKNRFSIFKHIAKRMHIKSKTNPCE